MRKLFVIIPLLIGSLNAKELNKSITITKTGIKYALSKNYAQLMKYSQMSDECYKGISNGKHDDLDRCEGYQQIVKDIQVRIERLEDLKRRYYHNK
jgi:hypothetical protein